MGANSVDELNRLAKEPGVVGVLAVNLSDKSIVFSTASEEMSQQYATLAFELQQTVRSNKLEAKVLRLRTKEHEIIVTYHGDFLMIGIHAPK